MMCKIKVHDEKSKKKKKKGRKESYIKDLLLGNYR